MLSIFCDGGSRGNPGPAACAFVVFNPSGTIVYQSGQYLGNTTNNLAEYQAVINALQWLRQNDQLSNPVPVNFYLDSQLVINQLNGLYKIKHPILKLKYLEILKLKKNLKFKIVNFSYLPRSQNYHADALVNETLDRN